jgi:uncharacterized protein YjbI with pentapeptide repeats
MKIEIKHWLTGRILFEGDFSSLADALTNAAKGKNNLEGAYLKGAYLEDANLKGAYLEGANLEGANLEGANLEVAYLEGAYLKDAYLEGAYLRGAYLEGANLEGANLKGAYLEGANLKGAYLEDAYLEGANLEGANLEGAYLEGAYLEGAYLKKLPPVPVVKNIDSKILEAVRAEGNHLDMATWHSCGTTHCRGGWAIQIAGKAGKKLEDATSAELAAILIYGKSRPGKPIPNFYATNANAMADLEACAAAEKAE